MREKPCAFLAKACWMWIIFLVQIPAENPQSYNKYYFSKPFCSIAHFCNCNIIFIKPVEQILFLHSVQSKFVFSKEVIYVQISSQIYKDFINETNTMDVNKAKWRVMITSVRNGRCVCVQLYFGLLSPPVCQNSLANKWNSPDFRHSGGRSCWC